MPILGVVVLVLVLAALAAVVVLLMAGRTSEPDTRVRHDQSHEAQSFYDAMQRGAENQRNNSGGSRLS